MTTIRKIVTSQVDGNSANTDVNNEIRPFGEASFFIDTSGDTDKLVLSMFEGQRTHLRSKVLSPGVFYGSNADSGDGVGLDTIKLIPDTSLHYNDGNYGNDQYLIVDPTAPNHIHIRAGGTIDNSSADLFIGGELNHVKISDSADTVSISTDAGEGNTQTWTFGNNGDVTFPGSSNAKIGEDEPGLVVYSDNGFAILTNAASGLYEVEFIGSISNGFGDQSGATLNVTSIVRGIITNGMTIYGVGLPIEGWTLTFGTVMEPQGNGGTGNYYLAGANYLISSQSFNNGVAAGSKSWVFESNGNLTFPDATVQTTAWTGIPGPYADDAAAATAGVAVGKTYYQNSGQVFVRLT